MTDVSMDGVLSADATASSRANPPLRVLFCTLNYFPVPAGGAERQAQLQAEELVRRGFEVTVVCPRDGDARSATVNGVVVRRLFRIRRRPLQRITYLMSLSLYLIARLRIFDLVHIHLANLQADVIVPLAHVFHRPTYVKVACGGYAGEVSRLGGVARVTRWFGLRHADRVQALSKEIVDELASIGISPDRIVRIPNGIDGRGFTPATPDERVELRRDLGLPLDGVIVLFLGRFAAYKGLDDLLAIWDRVRTEDATLLLVGEAETDRPIAPIAEREGLIVRGWATDPRPYLRAADVFVYPSHADGMSNAVLEAMACGLAVVASTSGATAEVVGHDEALLFPPQDRERLAEHLARAVSDSGLRRELQERAPALARRLDIREVVTQIDAEYRAVVQRR